MSDSRASRPEGGPGLSQPRRKLPTGAIISPMRDDVVQLPADDSVAPLMPAEVGLLVTGSIAPVRTTIAYRLALVLVAAVMILLPLVYLSLIAVVGWGVVWHLEHNSSMLQGQRVRGRAAILAMMLYVAPAVIGGVLVLFMLKPLMAGRQKRATARSLRPEDEPTLFALVERVCRALGAPMPKRIDVDLQLNASAAHRRGLLSLVGNDLVLTIGLPLAAGLSVEQFAGVLAHEFGHFTQGAGMGFGALVSRINAWFARVVWERDSWDETLVHWSNTVDFRIGWILWLARLCVGLTRKILFGLMAIGHAVSCHLSRQMEFDADRHQVRLVGSEVFTATFQRLARLGISHHRAIETLRGSHLEGVTVDSMPDLVIALAGVLSAEEEATIDKAIAAEKTGILATHPATHERIQRATDDTDGPPLVACREPASRLFSDFPALCRELTRSASNEAGPDAPGVMLVRPAADVLALQRLEHEAAAVARRWLAGDTCPHLPFPGAGPAMTGSAAECHAAWAAARATLQAADQLKPEEMEGLVAPLARFQRAALLESFVKAQGACEEEESGLTLSSVADVERFRSAAWEEFQTLARPLIERRHQIDRRLRSVLGWLATPEAAVRFEDAEDRCREASHLSQALAAMATQQDAWTALNGQAAAMMFWITRAIDPDTSEAALPAASATIKLVTQSINAIRQALLSAPYPLGHADSTMSLGRYLVANEVEEGEPAAVLDAAARLEALYSYLAWQLVGRLALRVEQVESVLDGAAAW